MCLAVMLDNLGHNAKSIDTTMGDGDPKKPARIVDIEKDANTPLACAYRPPPDGLPASTPGVEEDAPSLGRRPATRQDLRCFAGAAVHLLIKNPLDVS
jgi:hypothetical protein